MPEWPFPLDDPYPAYRAARERAAVQWSDELEAHLVLAHEPAGHVLREWRSDPRSSPAAMRRLGGSELFAESLLTSDAPVHTRLRKAVNAFFTPHAVRGLRERIGAIVDAALEDDDLEVVADLAAPVPLAVMAELFDVGTEGAQVLQAETPALVGLLELDPDPPVVEAAITAALNVMLFLVPIVADRTRNPGDDLISALAHDGTLTTDEVITTGLLLLAAGHITTTSLIGNGALALLEHHATSPGPDFVEEVLRLDSPAQAVLRVAPADGELGGTPVRAGDQAFVIIGAANRDPAVFAEPDRFDPARRGRHLAFGLGPHFCAGAGLARLEAEETFARLAPRLVDRGWEVERAPSRTFRRLQRLAIAPTAVVNG